MGRIDGWGWTLLTYIIACSEASSTVERTILFQDHNGAIPEIPELSQRVQNGEVEVTSQQTRYKKLESSQWRIPIVRSNNTPTTASILQNELTSDGWLMTHATWVKPVSCEEVAGRPGKSGHDANLMFGNAHDFKGGYDSNIVVHPVCIPERAILPHGSGNFSNDNFIDLHGRVCGAAQCIKNDVLKFEQGECKEALVTESDLPGPHYISSLKIRGISNVIASDTVGIAQFDPASSSGVSREGTTASSALLGYTTVCALDDFSETSILTNPLNGYKYTRASMRIKGVVHGIQSSLTSTTSNDVDNECSFTEARPIENALVEIWQSDAYGRYDREPVTPLAQSLLERGVLNRSNLTLPIGACRGILRTDVSGYYVADSEVPGSTGPPQHVNFRVSAPGFKTLNTVLYLGDDPALFTLVKDPDAMRAMLKNPNVVQFEAMVGNKNPAPPPQGSTLSLSLGSKRDGDDGTQHAYEVVFNITLDSLTHNSLRNRSVKNANMKSGVNAFDSGESGELDGLWSDPSSGGKGGMIHVESQGIRIRFTEVPTMRKWGTTEALLIGGKLRYADFRDKASVHHYSTSNSDLSSLLAQDAPQFIENIQTKGGLDTGSIFVTQRSRNGVSSGAGMSIHWNGIGSAWFKQPRPLKYRFIKLTMYGTTRQQHSDVTPSGHFLNINELAFYEGFSFLKKVKFETRDEAQLQGTDKQMNRITCSSEQESHPCWFALDDDGTRFWRTEDVGHMPASNNSKANVDNRPYGTTSYFSTKQWIEVDLGSLTPSKWLLPTGMAILCDAEPMGDTDEHAHAGAQRTPHDDSSASSNGKTKAFRDCPSAFLLQGSTDGLYYQDIYSRGGVGDWLTADYYREAFKSDAEGDLKRGGRKGWPTKDVLAENDRVSGAAFFDFSHAHQSSGRLDGARCGSCDRSTSAGISPCAYDSFDASCSSSYCDKQGICAPQEEMTCPLGYYLTDAVTEATIENQNIDINATSPIDKSVKEMKVTALSSSKPPPYASGRTNYDGDSYVSLTSTCLPCDEGYYGQHLWHRTSTCHGKCEAGYYCPEGSTSKYENQCGSDDVYCPEGSSQPTRVAAGFFSTTYKGLDHLNDASIDSFDELVNKALSESLLLSASNLLSHGKKAEMSLKKSQLKCLPGTYCSEGVAHLCPIGYYGSSQGLSTAECDGKCFAGSHCPEGSTKPIICPLGHYCPDGLKAYPCAAGLIGNTTGLASPKCSHKCPRGSYCPSGSSSPIVCPAGVYGSSEALSTDKCSGPCPEGYYCPPESLSPTRNNCGGPHVFCPLGSALPVPVSEGFYTLGGTPNNQARQAICEPGNFCFAGLKRPCRAGTYGSSYGIAANPNNVGISTSEEGSSESEPSFYCEGFCARGHWCGEGSISSKQNKCPAGSYGARTGETNKNCSGLCERGHYCPSGSVSSTELPCPAGRFGNRTGLATAECSSECSLRTLPSLMREQYADTELNFDSNSGVADVVQQVTACEPSICYEGYYCPEKSVSGKQRECGGNAYYCPPGSEAPLLVSDGFYSIGGDGPNTRTAQILCEPGHYCKQGVRRKCPAGVYGNSYGLSTSQCDGRCAPGHYCPQSSTSYTQVRCPAGRYGAPVRNDSLMSTHQNEVKVNYQVTLDGVGDNDDDPGLMNTLCHGKCEAGYYCPEGSTSKYEYPCGSDDVYCPEGAGKSFKVRAGYYSVGGKNATVRTSQLPCEPGTFCSGGIKFDCPAGSYGSESKLSNASCSGLCERGHYCPSGSVSSTELPCPAGRFGSERGLKTSKCSGSCLRHYRCREASVDQFGEHVNTGEI